MLPYQEYVKAYVQWQFVDPKKHGGLILLAALADEVVQRKSIQPVDGSFEKAVKLIQLGQVGKEHGVIGNIAMIDLVIGGPNNPLVNWSSEYYGGIARAEEQMYQQPVSVEECVRKFYRENPLEFIIRSRSERDVAEKIWKEPRLAMHRKAKPADVIMAYVLGIISSSENASRLLESQRIN
ncbi:hypothetical protein HYW20_04035 [Candidatus Woesearchaeota archaeon]|nr:hypothetical protein [Candidatus Woesearchaeota archaeon]